MLDQNRAETLSTDRPDCDALGGERHRQVWSRLMITRGVFHPWGARAAVGGGVGSRCPVQAPPPPPALRRRPRTWARLNLRGAIDAWDPRVVAACLLALLFIVAGCGGSGSSTSRTTRVGVPSTG